MEYCISGNTGDCITQPSSSAFWRRVRDYLIPTIPWRYALNINPCSSVPSGHCREPEGKVRMPCCIPQLNDNMHKNYKSIAFCGNISVLTTPCVVEDKHLLPPPTSQESMRLSIPPLSLQWLGTSTSKVASMANVPKLCQRRQGEKFGGSSLRGASRPSTTFSLNHDVTYCHLEIPRQVKRPAPR